MTGRLTLDDPNIGHVRMAWLEVGPVMLAVSRTSGWHVQAWLWRWSLRWP